MVMVTPLISPLELICTVCLLPLVLSVRLAANPAASTNTSIAPPPAVPWSLPKMLRLASLQFPESVLPGLSHHWSDQICSCRWRNASFASGSAQCRPPCNPPCIESAPLCRPRAPPCHYQPTRRRNH